MFGIDSSELMLIALVALLVIGPKDLPKAMRWVGQWVGKARAMSRHLRTGFDSMMREAELEEMQKLWAQQNDAIMKATALPENMLPDLSGPHISESVPAEPAYEAWPAPPPEAAAEAAAEAVVDAPPVKKPRKPRAKKPAAAPEGEQA
ncbi:Sec-independent protein translocase protein TatB [Sandarakinorhabdus sp.]|uniref:Sec-independent protein translocase protein TatB n=1 Tax=Sandarakinorhabdus sp. TaxID=1916663 RepID=UPI00286D7653|nr:Sec-independent protein translocase protein TatB [Sandarakinorhabdus sp.]